MEVAADGNVSRQTGIDIQRLPEWTAISAQIRFEVKRYQQMCLLWNIKHKYCQVVVVADKICGVFGEILNCGFLWRLM